MRSVGRELRARRIQPSRARAVVRLVRIPRARPRRQRGWRMGLRSSSLSMIIRPRTRVVRAHRCLPRALRRRRLLLLLPRRRILLPPARRIGLDVVPHAPRHRRPERARPAPGALLKGALCAWWQSRRDPCAWARELPVRARVIVHVPRPLLRALR